MFYFKRKREGAYTEGRKSRTEHKATENATVPKQLYYPLSMHIGKPAKPIVEVGQKVKIGTILAEQEGPVSANVISSVSGEVAAITECDTLNGKGRCIVVRNDYREEWGEPLFPAGMNLTREEKLEMISKAGIVGMGGATFPTSVKLSPPPEKKIDTLIINGAECESYATSDHRLMLENASELIEGIRVLQEVLQVKQTYIGIESDSHECVAAMQAAIGDTTGIEVRVLEIIYPQGSEKNLIKNLAGREVPPGGLPADVRTVVLNTATTFAIYEAVRLGKPLIQRITTVTGEPLREAKNLWVRIGTPIDSLIEDCAGFRSLPGKLLHGGPMMGRAINSGSVPVTKGTSVITFLPVEDARDTEEVPCIRCSECLNVCPVSLQPILISNAYVQGDVKRAEELGAMDCIECGNCTFICPSKIPLLDNIRAAKAAIKAAQKG